MVALEQRSAAAPGTAAPPAFKSLEQKGSTMQKRKRQPEGVQEVLAKKPAQAQQPWK
jgi:hypothetical protein